MIRAGSLIKLKDDAAASSDGVPIEHIKADEIGRVTSLVQFGKARVCFPGRRVQLVDLNWIDEVSLDQLQLGDKVDLFPPGVRVSETCVLVGKDSDGVTEWRTCRTGHVFELSPSGLYVERKRHRVRRKKVS